MDVFKRLSDLSTYLDNELHQMEASLQVILTSGRKYEDPAERAVDVQDEIKELSNQIDQLTQLGTEQVEHFDGFLNGMVDNLNEFDEKISKIENHASKYGYQITTKEKTDLKTSLEEAIVSRIGTFFCIVIVPQTTCFLSIERR